MSFSGNGISARGRNAFPENDIGLPMTATRLARGLSDLLRTVRSSDRPPLILVLSWPTDGAHSVPNGRKNSVTLRPEVAAVLTLSSVLVWLYWWDPSPNAPPVLFVLA